MPTKTQISASPRTQVAQLSPGASVGTRLRSALEHAADLVERVHACVDQTSGLRDSSLAAMRYIALLQFIVPSELHLTPGRLTAIVNQPDGALSQSPTAVPHKETVFRERDGAHLLEPVLSFHQND